MKQHDFSFHTVHVVDCLLHVALADKYKKARPQRVFQRRLAGCGASVRSRHPGSIIACRTGVSSPQNNAPVTCDAGSLACSSSPLGPFPTLRAEVFSRSKSFGAKLLVCRVHFPSSPTMSLRSEDAETTRGAKLAACFVRVFKRLLRALARPAEPSPGTGIAQAGDVTKTRRFAWQRNWSLDHLMRSLEALTNWLAQRVETHVVHRSPMSRKLVEKLSCPCLPDGHALVPAPGCDLLPLGIPACFQEVAFLAAWCSVVRLYASVCRCEWPHIPCPDGGVMRVREQGLVVWRHLKRGYRVCVAKECVCDGLLPQIPNLDVVVNTSRE
jgi:hypothetical protein